MFRFVHIRARTQRYLASLCAAVRIRAQGAPVRAAVPLGSVGESDAIMPGKRCCRAEPERGRMTARVALDRLSVRHMRRYTCRAFCYRGAPIYYIKRKRAYLLLRTVMYNQGEKSYIYAKCARRGRVKNAFSNICSNSGRHARFSGLKHGGEQGARGEDALRGGRRRKGVLQNKNF